MSLHRFAPALLPFATVMTMIAACSDDDGTTTSAQDAGDITDGRVEASTTHDSDTADDAAADGAGPANACATASASLSSSADAQAPVLDASTSNLQRVTSNDTFCTTQKNGAHPTFGAYGYLLNVFLHDAEGDGPTLTELTTAPAPVRFASAPTFNVADKYDPEHGFSTQGESFILQLCLDEAYAAGTVTIAVDVADKAGHRSKAICITEATGG